MRTVLESTGSAFVKKLTVSSYLILVRHVDLIDDVTAQHVANVAEFLRARLVTRLRLRENSLRETDHRLRLAERLLRERFLLL